MPQEETFEKKVSFNHVICIYFQHLEFLAALKAGLALTFYRKLSAMTKEYADGVLCKLMWQSLKIYAIMES